MQDPSLLKGAVADSNVAAQQEGIAALCAFLKFGGREGCVRTRNLTVGPLVEKGLPSTRPAIKASSLEALLLYIELDVATPIVEDILPALGNKQPKVVAAALAALTAIYHSYGCKTVDPKPVLKAIAKPFGHADKNVRAEATNLAVEFYRWLRDAMKPTFWGDLKPTQQTDLEAQFEKIKSEPPPKQERFLRSQQAAMSRAPPPGAAGGDDYDDDVEDAPVEVDAFDLAEPQDVLGKVKGEFYDGLASSKWKDRKEALEGLYALLNVPRIKDGDFGEINRGLAKCMKDANVAVVTQAAQCIDVLAKGLRKAYAKYRAIVMAPIMERLKEKKASVAEALGTALDAVFLSTGLTECLEDITTFLAHKNPQVKEGTMKFLIRCLRTTRDVPSKSEIATIVEGGKKLLAEGSEILRSGGAEVLGTVMKIIGERAMNPHMEGLDDIRKAKVKEFFETAEVKARDKPKPPPAPAGRGPGGAAGPPKKLMGGGGKKPALGTKKPLGAAPVARPPSSPELSPPPQPASRPPPSKLGMPKPSGLTAGLKAPQKRMLPGPGPAGAGSPRRPLSVTSQPAVEEEPPIPQPRMGMARGGLAGRNLQKPTPQLPQQHDSGMGGGMAPGNAGISAMERVELEELRAANERLVRSAEELRLERARLGAENAELKAARAELQNEKAALVEQNTRDMLSMKAKESQLVRARADAEAAEQVNERLRRELERLKRALNRAEGFGGAGSPGVTSPVGSEDGGAGALYPGLGARGNRMSFASTLSEEKENGDGGVGVGVGGMGGGGIGATGHYARAKITSPVMGDRSGRGSPARGFRSIGEEAGASDRLGSGLGGGGATQGQPGGGVESWKRAAEVTSQLKARIEQMKAKQGMSR